MTRILVDLAERQVADLAVIVKAERRPRAAVIRDAVDAYIALHGQVSATEVFGIWRNGAIGTRSPQRELRQQW